MTLSADKAQRDRCFSDWFQRQTFDGTTTIRQASQAAFEAGRRERGWISVEERLPERSDEYLIVDSECGVMPADFMVALENIRESQWRTVRSYGQDCEEQELYNVTHWMPLPNGPEAGGKRG